MSDDVPLPPPGEADATLLPPPEADAAPPAPKPDDPATMEELVEMLGRTPAEEEALDALAGDPSGQTLEALRQHLRHGSAPPEDQTPA
jgi:hypothetical protein